MLLKKFVPYYDERFRGYYWNKVQHLMHISMQDSFTFVIHPEAFVVHVPHRKPSTKMRTRRSGQKERNHVMFLEALEDMKRDRFVPVTGFPHLCLPPVMQRAAAAVVANEEQKAALLRMASVVRKIKEEELPGGGAEALARARGKPFDPNAAAKSTTTTSTTTTTGSGELPVKAERPEIPGTAEAKAKAKQAQQLRDAEELEQDLQEQAEADAARKSGSKSSSKHEQSSEEARNENDDDVAAAEAAAIADAQEKTAFVQQLLAKENKRKASLSSKGNTKNTGTAAAALYPDDFLAADHENENEQEDAEEEEEEQEQEEAMQMELADAAEEFNDDLENEDSGSFEIEEESVVTATKQVPLRAKTVKRSSTTA
jgi:hypothetical protein